MPMCAARQAFQQGSERLQALCVQTAERLAGAVPAGQLKRTGTAFAALLQQLEFGTQLLRGGLADEAEPALQQGIGFLWAGVLAQLQINDGEAENVLVGSTDEQTDRTMELYCLNNTIKKEADLPADYLNSNTNGVIWGEGASFFVIGKDKTENSYAKLKNIQISNKVELNEVKDFIQNFLVLSNH